MEFKKNKYNIEMSANHWVRAIASMAAIEILYSVHAEAHQDWMMRRQTAVSCNSAGVD